MHPVVIPMRTITRNSVSNPNTEHSMLRPTEAVAIICVDNMSDKMYFYVTIVKFHTNSHKK
jgi:hypothetical protein